MSEDDLKLVKECAIQLYVYALQRNTEQYNSRPIVEDRLLVDCINKSKNFITKINKILEE